MQNLILLLVMQVLVSCATSTPQTNKLVKHSHVYHDQFEIKDVPFIEQDAYQCGPATMAMTLNFWGKKTDVRDLKPLMFTKGLEGTFQSEMLTTPRLYGYQSLMISSLDSLLKELEAQHPVIIFQNLGFSFAPKWHYALAIGYDINGPDIIMHSGPDEKKRMDMRLFERNWKLADFWGLMVLPPDSLSASLGEKEHSKAGSALEEIGKIQEAELVYKTVLKKWPHSYLALIGMGNVTYQRKEFRKSISYLKQAVGHYPESPEAWHNLATAQGAGGFLEEARKSSRKALTLVEASERQTYEVSLKDWLTAEEVRP